MCMITLLTDFGTADGFAAAMKGVMLAAAPDARILDASHEIPPHDVRAGAWALRHYAPLFPPETIHVAVVDPGVGSSRKALLIRADRQWFIGPDNGLFSWVLREARSARAFVLRSDLRRVRAVGSTFDGRDLFAVAAGALASGKAWRSLVSGSTRPMRFSWPTPKSMPNGIRGKIIHIDRFGNAISNIPTARIPANGQIEISCNHLKIREIKRTYSEACRGEAIAVCESTGLLEIAVVEGNASIQHQISIGDAVIVVCR